MRFLKRYSWILSILLFFSCSSTFENNLAGLQKAYIFAVSDQEREIIINELENYFKNMEIPDSIENALDDSVNALLKRKSSDQTNSELGAYRNTPNVYELELKLKNAVKNKIISLAKGENPDFSLLDSVAFFIDEHTGIQYWTVFLANIKEYTPEKARLWLKVNLAIQESKYLSGDLREVNRSFSYAICSYKNVKMLNDPRMLMDNIQPIAFILYGYYALHDISIAFTEKYLERCRNIGYYLRLNGLQYHIAESRLAAGKYEDALENYKSVVSFAKKKSDVPFMDWYVKSALLGIADIYFWMGKYKASLAICDSVEQMNPNPKQRLSLLNIRGYVNRNLGNYYIAEKEYDDALELAEKNNDLFYTITVYNNFGYMYMELSEYDKALEYFSQALSVMDDEILISGRSGINVLVNLINVYTELNDTLRIKETIRNAEKILDQLGDVPLHKADLLNTIGKIQLDRGIPDRALSLFEQAEELCDRNSLIKIGMRVKINLANSMVELSQFNRAESKLTETLSIAKKIGDRERAIDAYASFARLEYRKGNIQKAISISNLLIKEVIGLSNQFRNSQRLIAYQQKINDYLKQTVIYELEFDRTDSAIVKLDFAKSLTYLTLNEYSGTELKNYPKLDITNILNRLPSDVQILNYMVHDETLYFFLLNRGSITVRSKRINSDSLKSKIQSYLAAIKNTIKIFNDYDQQKVEEHYILTTKIGYKLYEILLDGINITNDSSPDSIKTLFIIPDDYIHYVPLSTLVFHDAGEIEYLIQKINIAYLPGLFSLIAPDNDYQKSAIPSMLVSADPDMVDMNKLNSLLRQYFPHAKSLEKNSGKITGTEILNELNKPYNMYLFAGHSYANIQSVSESFIEITVRVPDKNSYEKLKFTLPDVYKIDWRHADLVYLLGCETAGGNLYRGIGISGLQTSFLLSGANCVLASLWQIDAAQSIKQAADFFQDYKQSGNSIGALRHVQLESIKRLKTSGYFKYPHPYFWGSYLLAKKKYN